MANTYDSHDKSWNQRPALSPSLSPVLLQRKSPFLSNESHKQTVFPVSVGKEVKFPQVSGYRTSYRNDYRKKEKIAQHLPRPQSPTRTNRPHPRNVYYLERLDNRQLVCDVKTVSNGGVDKMGAQRDSPSSFTRTCTQESFLSHPLSPDCINTRYGSNKEKYQPARGIVPIISRSDVTPSTTTSPKKKRDGDHWLPGTLKLTTTMTMKGPFQYLPRKRKTFVIDTTAAGMVGGIQSEEHRYHNVPKSRGLMPPMMTIRAAV